MTEATLDTLGPEAHMPIDIDFHDHDHIWIEEKGEKMYERMKEYLEHKDTDEDREKRMIELFYPEMVLKYEN